MVLIQIERFFFTFLHVFLLPCIHIYAQHSITCDAGTSYVGQASNVTCYFYKDIKANKTAISVVMVPTSNKKEKEERDVIQCSWAKLATKPECLVSEGYTFNYEVTDRLTVEIPSTTANFAGVYSCHIVPPNGATFKTCELIVKDTKRMPALRGSATESCQQGSTTMLEVPEWLLGMLIVILILQIISILCVLVLCWIVRTIRRHYTERMSGRWGRLPSEDDTARTAAESLRREQMISGPPQQERAVEERHDDPEVVMLDHCPDT